MPTPKKPTYDIYEYDAALYMAAKHGTHYQHELNIRRAGFKAMADELRRIDQEWLQSIKDVTKGVRDAA